MSLKQHYKCVEERRTRGKKRENSHAYYKMSDEKLIATVQVCLRCGRTFSFKRNRKRCPRCQRTLRTRIMILKAP